MSSGAQDVIGATGGGTASVETTTSPRATEATPHAIVTRRMATPIQTARASTVAADVAADAGRQPEQADQRDGDERGEIFRP